MNNVIHPSQLEARQRLIQEEQQALNLRQAKAGLEDLGSRYDEQLERLVVLEATLETRTKERDAALKLAEQKDRLVKGWRDQVAWRSGVYRTLRRIYFLVFSLVAVVALGGVAFIVWDKWPLIAAAFGSVWRPS